MALTAPPLSGRTLSHWKIGHRSLLLFRRRHQAWATAGFAFALLALGTLGLAVVDERTINGVSVWNKPFKFALSTAIYFASLTWFAPLLKAGHFRTPAGHVLTWLPIICAVLEVAYITIQGALGEASHFNTATPFHSAMYSLMAIGAIGLVGVCAWIALLLLTWNGTRDVYVFGVAVGLLMTFLLGGGFGLYLGGQESHWVGGAESDANGLWLFNWSRDGGDLRVAHFFGIHAMQFIPLVAHTFRYSARGIAVVSVFALGYAALTLATFRQAVLGLPLL